MRVRTASILIAVLVLGACSSSSKDGSSSTTSSTTSTTVASTTPTSAAEAQLSLAGFRQLRFGMTPAEAGAALGAPPTTGPDGNDACADVSFAAVPSGLELYVIEGKIVAAEIGPDSGVIAEGGTHIGSTVDEVRRALGADVVSQPSDDQTRTDLVYRTADPATAGNEIRFAFVDGKVSDILAGIRTYVDQQELCG